MRERAGLLLLLWIRGLLLWILLPVATLLWLLRWPYTVLRRRPLKLGAVLGWADLNLVVILKLSILRSFKLGPARFIPWREVAAVDHRPNLLDLA
jgi:hypothetical protein